MHISNKCNSYPLSIIHYLYAHVSSASFQYTIHKKIIWKLWANRLKFIISFWLYANLNLKIFGNRRLLYCVLNVCVFVCLCNDFESHVEAVFKIIVIQAWNRVSRFLFVSHKFHEPRKILFFSKKTVFFTSVNQEIWFISFFLYSWINKKSLF